MFVLIAHASSEDTDEPAHQRNLACSNTLLVGLINAQAMLKSLALPARTQKVLSEGAQI